MKIRFHANKTISIFCLMLTSKNVLSNLSSVAYLSKFFSVPHFTLV
jgi:hypothetical protein